jgi:DNA-binding transcriptional LysR family regulator
MLKHRKLTGTPPPEPTLEEMWALLAVLDAGSVTRGAEQLGMEQPTLSRRLAVFKRPGGDGHPVLQHRGPKGGQLELTDKGRQVLPAIRALVRQYDQVLQFLDGAAPQAEVVRLGAGQFALRHYLPRTLAALMREDVPCEVRPVVLRGRDRIAGVCAGELDLAVVTHTPRQIAEIASESGRKPDDIAAAPLASQPLCIIGRRRETWSKAISAVPAERTLREADLVGCPLVGLDPQSGIRRTLESRLSRAGLALTFVAGTGLGGWPAAKEYVRLGLGVAILPAAELDPGDAAEFVIRRLPESLAVTDYLVRPKARLSAAQDTVFAAMIRAAGDQVRESRGRWSDPEAGLDRGR